MKPQNPKEIMVGTKVRVIASRANPHLQGRTGTITQRYTLPRRTAFQVRFEDGGTEVLWHHELEEIHEQPS